ncbi:MAG TPA: amidohydrolase family protein [Thermodesulfobacteriota bacterium]
MKKMLINAERVLPISSLPVIKGSVLIVDGKIQEVGKTSKLKRKYKGVETIDLGNGILLPGFVNAHTHLELGWLNKRIRKFNGFIEWLTHIIKAKMEGTTRAEIEVSVDEGIKGLIESGVTTVGEVSSYGGLDKPSLKKSGIRSVVFSELFDWHGDFWEIFSFNQNELFEERPFPHSLYSCSPDFLKKVWRFNQQKGIPSGIHLAESRDEVKFVKGLENDFEKKIFPLIGREPFLREKTDTPLQYLKRLKFFNGTKVTAVHMVQIFPEDIEDINKHDIGIVLCPRSNSFLKVGNPPIKYYLKVERIGIGTDGLSSNLNLDFFEELRFFYLTHGKKLGSKSPYFTIYLATLGGARALFLEDRIGSIDKGKEADLIFLSPKNAFQDPYMSVISCCKEDVKLVMVKGNVLSSKIKTPINCT